MARRFWLRGYDDLWLFSRQAGLEVENAQKRVWGMELAEGSGELDQFVRSEDVQDVLPTNAGACEQVYGPLLWSHECKRH